MGKKISELAARTALSNNDIFVVVDEPGTGSAETAKVTYTTLRDSIIAEAGFNTVGNDQILDPASAGGNVTINASATVNGDFTVSGNTVINTGSQIVSNPDDSIIINPGGTGDTIIESELITNGPITANNNLSVNGDFSVTGTIGGISLLDLDNANTAKISDGTAAQLLTTDGSGNFRFIDGASTKGAFTDGARVIYDDQQDSITGITQANPGVITVAAGHNLVNGDQITITGVTGMTEVNDQSYFVSVSGDDLTLYSDSALTSAINSTGFTAYISGGATDSGDGAFVAGTVGSTVVAMDDLSDADTTTNAPSNGDRLHWDGTNWVPVAPTNGSGGTSGTGTSVGEANTTNMSLTGGESLVWHSFEYDIVSLSESGGQLYVDLGLEAHGFNHLGSTEYGVFDMSSAVGATEINYDANIRHVLVRVNNDPAVNSWFGVLATPEVGGAVTQYLGGNTSAWSSGGKFIRVNSAEPDKGANTGGGYTIGTGLLAENKDVSAATPTDRQALVWDNANSTWKPDTVVIDDLGDVDTTTTAPTDGQALVWDNANSIWKPDTVSGSTGGVSIVGTAPTDGQSVAWDDQQYPVGGATQANPVVLTIPNNNLTTGDTITVTGVTGMTELNNQTYTVTVSGDSVTLDSIDGTGFTTYISGGIVDSGTGAWASTSTITDLSTSVIDDLSDVDTTTTAPTDGQALVWDNANSTWKPDTVSGGGGGIDDLTDVDTSTNAPTNGQLLVWNASSSEWVGNTVNIITGSYKFDSPTQEKITIDTTNSGLADYDCANSAIHYLSNITSDVEANLTNLPLDTGYATTVSFILIQGTTPRMVDVLKITGAAQTIKWVGGAVPTGTASGVDAVSFSIIRTATSTYTVLGQSVPFS